MLYVSAAKSKCLLKLVIVVHWYLLAESKNTALIMIRTSIKMEGRKEGNVLFNDALNTFYFTVIWRWTYGKGPFT